MKPMKKDFWLWFIDHTSKELVELSCINNEQIKKAREQLNKIRADEELMERIRLEEAYELDENTKLANAEERGEKRNKIETAKKMLAENMDIALISKLTELSIEEIKKNR